MQIIDNKALMLNLRNPKQVTTVIPKSKELKDNRVLVNWGVDETRILRNLNIKAPSPITGKYQWTGKHKPFDHQKKTAEFLTLNQRAFCFSEMGVGKTASSIWAADFLMTQGIISRVLVICPLSIMDSAWRNDLFTFAMHRKVDVAHGSAVKRRKLIAGNAEFVIINYDGVKVVSEDIAAGGFDLIIVDECFVAGTPVHTPTGTRAIETLKAGDMVLTSNGEQPIKRLVRNTSKSLVRVKLSNGRHIDTTEEHPFYTDFGWVIAKNLRGRRLISKNDVCGMRQHVSDNAKQVAVAQKEQYQHWSDLLTILRSEEVAHATRGGVVLQSYATGTTGQGWHLRTDTGNSQSNFPKAESLWAQTSNTKRQRHWDDSMRETCYEPVVGLMGMELPNSVGEEAARLSYQLQNRLREPNSKGWDRSGWGQSFGFESKSAGQEKREQASGIWVESVTPVQRGSITPVYNIEVEGTPNYFVGDGVLVHNCNAYKNANTDRWKTLSRLIQPHTWLWMMTGTPAAQTPTDAYGLAKLVNPQGVPRAFGRFRDQVMYKVTQFKWVPKPDAVNTVHNVLQPAIRFTKAECLDLPDMVYVDRQVELTPQQKKYYEALRTRLVLEAAGEVVTAQNAAISLSKLLQISAGAVYTDDHETLEFDIKNRYNVMKEVIEETSQKVLVFVPFKHVISLLKERLMADGITADVINGDVPAHKRTEVFKRFQETKDPQVLIIQPQAAAHGVTLTAADTVIWWGPTASVETYAQANARVHRAGQTHKCTVVHLQGSTAEKHIYSMLSNKMDIHTQIIDLYKQILD